MLKTLNLVRGLKAILAILALLTVTVFSLFFKYSVPTQDFIETSKRAYSAELKDKTEKERFLIEFLIQEKLSGAALYSQGDRIVAEVSFGLADSLAQTKIENSTVFDLGSLTKQFTGFLALEAIQKGKISLTDRIEKFLPELHKTPFGQITFEQLILMTSGLPDMLDPYRFISSQTTSRIYSPEDFLQMIKDYKLRSTPGTKFEYSNIAYKLISIIVGRLEKKNFAELVQERIFSPLKMRDSFVEGSYPDGPKNAAFGMLPIRFFSGERLLQLPHWNYSLIQGAGGILSNVRDLFKWNRYLSARAKADPKWSGKYFASGSEWKEGLVDFGYSFGWGRSKLKLGNGKVETVFLHVGEDPGYCSFVFRIPSTDELILLLLNSDRCLQEGWDEHVSEKLLSITAK